MALDAHLFLPCALSICCVCFSLLLYASICFSVLLCVCEWFTSGYREFALSARLFLCVLLRVLTKMCCEVSFVIKTGKYDSAHIGTTVASNENAKLMAAFARKSLVTCSSGDWNGVRRCLDFWLQSEGWEFVFRFLKNFFLCGEKNVVLSAQAVLMLCLALGCVDHSA